FHTCRDVLLTPRVFLTYSTLSALGCSLTSLLSVFFFNPTATTMIYTLSLHDALPICWRLLRDGRRWRSPSFSIASWPYGYSMPIDRKSGSAGMPRPISYAVFCLKKKNLCAEELLLRSANNNTSMHYKRMDTALHDAVA